MANLYNSQSFDLQTGPETAEGVSVGLLEVFGYIWKFAWPVFVLIILASIISAFIGVKKTKEEKEGGGKEKK